MIKKYAMCLVEQDEGPGHGFLALPSVSLNRSRNCRKPIIDNFDAETKQVFFKKKRAKCISPNFSYKPQYDSCRLSDKIGQELVRSTHTNRTFQS